MNNTGNNQFALNQSRNYKQQDFSPNKMDQIHNQNQSNKSKNQRFPDSIFKNPTQSFECSQNQEKNGKKGRSKVEWTLQEDAILFQNYIKQGSKWAQLSKILQPKSQNSIKNRFYCCIRKVQKKINLIQKKKKINHRKPVSLESLLTFLQLGKSSLDFFDGRFKNANQNALQIVQVKEAIIQEAMKPEAQLNESKIQKILVQILKLKHSLKFINVKRVKKTQKISQNEARNGSEINEDESYTNKGEETIMKVAQEKEQEQMIEAEKVLEPFEMIDYTLEKLQSKDSVTRFYENNLLCFNWESFDHDHLLIN